MDWRREYRQLEKRYNHFIRRYDQMQQERHFFKQRAYTLEADKRTLEPQVYWADRTIEGLRQQLKSVREENRSLKKQLQAVKAKHPEPAGPIPPFVKENRPQKPRKRPGREAGHKGAFRAIPEKIDREIEVPFARNGRGECCCPKCRCPLQKLKKRRRYVVDIVPAEPVAERYNTEEGYCPKCGKVVESRALEQPPAAEIPGPQVGINALAMAAVLRVVYRLPYEPITQLLADLSGLKLCKATIARQMQRMSRRLERMYELIGVRLKLSDSVHMDETSWRVDGKNQWLWTLLNSHYTLFHVDKSRGSEVVKKLLGEVYGGTLHSDFYCAYGEIDCKKQKCLVHLLRELRDSAQGSVEFAQGALCRRLKRLIREMLVLKQRKGKLKARDYQLRGRRLEERLRELANRDYADEDSRRIAKRLKKHEKELTLFLWANGVEADNNRAERALRPAVILRKITGGSRSERGAKATAVMMSIARTIRQHELPLLESFKEMLAASWANKPFDEILDKISADSS